MNTKSLAKNYSSLTPEERFRLILAASARGDEAERDSLSRAGSKTVLEHPDHSPYAHAFNEIAHFTFMELAEDAKRYEDAFVRIDDAREHDHDQDLESDDADDEGGKSGEESPGTADESVEDELAEDELAEDDEKNPVWFRLLDLALAEGFMLKTKAEGWQLFCERMSVPPYLGWDLFPGNERLQVSLKRTEKAAFVEEGFLRFLNRIRPKGAPKVTKPHHTAESIADDTEVAFRARVRWWGG